LAEIYFRKWGDAGQEALLLHPALASSEAWRGVAGYLSAEFKMTAIDLPGHGKSVDWDRTGDYHGQCCAAAAQFLDRPMHLIGHSFGATVALRLALESPEMVQTLTLIEPVFFAAAKGTPDYLQHETEFQPFVDAMQSGDSEHAARVFIRLWGAGATWDDLSAENRAYITARIDLIVAGSPAINDDNSAMLAKGRLETLSCPVLLMQGEKSPAVIDAINLVLSTKIPKTRSARIKGAGHMLPITHPRKTAVEIGDFIRSVTRV